jgi:hypothetical protein
MVIKSRKVRSDDAASSKVMPPSGSMVLGIKKGNCWAKTQPNNDAIIPAPESGTPSDFREHIDVMLDLMVLAFQTDSTRVATLEIGGSCLPQNLGLDKSYHSLSHHGNDEDAIANLITLETYQLEQFGKFLTRLAGIEDGEQSLLDSTSVLFGSGMGNGSSHTKSDLPIILAGGGYGNGQFKKVASEGVGKVPLCNLFVDIAQRMGVEKDSFGTSTGTFS